MESRKLTVQRNISEFGANIVHEYFVEKPDMSRAGMFTEINDMYDPNSRVMTVEGEVRQAVSLTRARQAVEDAFQFADDMLVS